MKANVRLRAGCRICGSKNLLKILSLPAMPFTDEFLAPGELGTEFLHDIDIYYCNDCRTAQTQHDVDVSDYYEDYQYTVGSSPTASTFMRSLAAKLMAQYFPGEKGIRVFEVGSGDGAQLAPFKEMGCAVLGFEPSSTLAKAAESIGVPTIQALFGAGSVEKLPSDFQHDGVQIALLSYTFDHLPDPLEFARAVSSILDKKRGLLVIEIHDLEKIVERREYCLFEHEHSIYLTRATAQALMQKAGLEVIDFEILSESERRANSLLFVATPKESSFASKRLPLIDLAEFRDPAFYAQQAAQIKTGIENLDRYLERKVAEGKSVAGYGAGGRGVMTLAAMKSASKLSYLIDKKPKGTNIVTPKSHVPVHGLEKLRQSPVDLIIVFSFGYIDEIRQELKAYGYRPEQFISMIDILAGRALV